MLESKLNAYLIYTHFELASFATSSKVTSPYEPTLFVKEGQTIYPTELTLTGPTTISVGEASEFTVGFEPSNTTYKNVTWSSSNDAIATVSNNGIVTGIKDGKVTITVTGYNDITPYLKT